VRVDGGCAQCCYVKIENTTQLKPRLFHCANELFGYKCSKTAEIYAHASNNDSRYNNVWIHRVICNWSPQDGANIRGAIG